MEKDKGKKTDTDGKWRDRK